MKIWVIVETYLAFDLLYASVAFSEILRSWSTFLYYVFAFYNYRFKTESSILANLSCIAR